MWIAEIFLEKDYIKSIEGWAGEGSPMPGRLQKTPASSSGSSLLTSIGKAAGRTNLTTIFRTVGRWFGAKPERGALEFRRTGPQGRKHFAAGRCLPIYRKTRERSMVVPAPTLRRAS
jgi:hypothetical protein